LAKKAAQMVADVKAQMVADVKAQMVAVMRSIDRRGFPSVPLAEMCNVNFGERITKKDNTGTLYPVYGSGNDSFKTDRFNRSGKTCKVGRFAISENSMVSIATGPYWLMDSGFTVDSKQPHMILTEYLWYCLLMDKPRLYKCQTRTCQANIDMNAFYQLTYVCPPLDFQQQVVARMDALQSQVDALESLHQQSEDNARFILESYLGTSSASSTSLVTTSSIATATSSDE
jgi:type I restriction enzyme S subunit